MATPVEDSELNVVHEAIDERQHVRTHLPASVQLKSQGQIIPCVLTDLSLGGMALKPGTVAVSKIEPLLTAGALVSLTLELKLHHCDLNLQLEGKVIDCGKQLIRISFVGLDRNRADTLRYLLSAWLAGDVVAVDGVLNVMARENHIKQRKTKAELNRNFGERLRAVLGTLAYMAVAIAIISLLTWKLFLYFFETRAVAAHAQGAAYVLSMPTNGQVSFLIPPGATEVSKGQPLAVVSSQLDTVFNTADDLRSLSEVSGENLDMLLGKAFVDTTISSPCDCLVYFPAAPMDRYALKEQVLIHLLPKDEPLYVEATFGFDQFERLKKIDRIELSRLNDPTAFTGEIVGTQIDQLNNTVKVRIKTTPELTVADYLRPLGVKVLAGVPYFDEAKDLLRTASER